MGALLGWLHRREWPSCPNAALAPPEGIVEGNGEVSYHIDSRRGDRIMGSRILRRRDALKLFGSATAMGILLTACGGGAPAAGQPTTAPAPTQAPQQAAPTQAAQQS